MLTLWEEPRKLLTLGGASPANRGCGMLFTKLGSPASTRPVSTCAAVGAAAYAAPLRKCQSWKSDMGCPSVRRDGELQDHRTSFSGLDRSPVGIEDSADQSRLQPRFLRIHAFGSLRSNSVCPPPDQ